jgi:multiple sugar transport system ATP-binding protein
VADFIGSPSMNFLNFTGDITKGQNQVSLGQHLVDVPQQLDDKSGELVLGVRPEHMVLTDGGKLRAEVQAVEYLGTSQIVVMKSEFGELKARVDSSLGVNVGESVGLEFKTSTITLFDQSNGRAICSELNEEVLQRG